MTRKENNVLSSLFEFIPKSGRFLLAVSGGKDSMSLLYASHEYAQSTESSFQVAHVDYQLREESCEDAQFVREHTEKLGLPYHELKAPAPPKGQNIESWARNVRYKFFAEIMSLEKLDATITAHTSNDMAETYLMRLLSNKEPKGIQTFDSQRRLIRPFLHVSQEQILLYLDRNKIPYRTDMSNFDTKYLRNQVRRQLIPYLEEEFDPRIAQVLSIRAHNVHQDIETLYEIAKEKIAPLKALEWGSQEWRREASRMVESERESIAWRIIELLLGEKLCFSLGRRHACLAADVILGKKVACELPNRWKMRRNKGGSISLEQSPKQNDVCNMRSH